MAKKLKVELDVDSSKAKSKVAKDLGGAVDAGGAATPASRTSASAERLERALDRAAKGAQSFGSETTKSSVNLSNAFKALAGFGAGMAVNWAANFMPEGKGRNYVEKAGSAMQGASVGAAVGDALGDASIFGIKLGKLTTAAGAVLGYAGKNAEQEKAKQAQLDSIKDQRSQFREAQQWRDMMRSMTEMPTSFGNAEGVDLLRKQLEAVQKMSATAADELEKLKDKARELGDAAEKAAQDDKLQESAEKMQELSRVQAQIMQAEAAQHNAKRQEESLANEITKKVQEKDADDLANQLHGGDQRGNLTSSDALAKIGGTVGGGRGGGPATESEESTRKGSGGKLQRTSSAGGTNYFQGVAARLEAGIDKALSARAPKQSKGIAFFQDDHSSDSMIDDYILDEEKKGNEYLKQIADAVRTGGMGTTWQ